MLPNKETGPLFGITYSAVSHILSSMRTRMQKEPDLRAKYKYLYSLCNIMTPRQHLNDDPNSPLDSLFYFSHGFSLDRPGKGTADKETFIKGCNLFTFG